MNMYTEDELNQMYTDAFDHDEVPNPATICGMVSTMRTLQQQNKQLIEEHGRMKRALEIVRDTLAHKVHEDRTSHGLHQEASAVLQSLQGGQAHDS